MGFGDSFKKVGKSGDFFKPTKDFGKNLEREARRGDSSFFAKKGAAFAFGPQDPSGGLITAGLLHQTSDRRTQRASEDVGAAGAISGGGAFTHLLKRDDDVNPPPVDELPAQGAGVRSAKQRAREQAIAAAKKRFGFSDTVATSPLGLQGEGAPLGKKTLIGA